MGVLFDFPQHDGGSSVQDAIRLGIATGSQGRLDRDVELVARQAHGLPAGTVHDVSRKFEELVSRGVLAIVGPSISDNGLVIGRLAEDSHVPCINYTGGEHTRSAWMFHYQVGSLEEEPLVLVDLLRRESLSRVALVHDKTPVGRRYADSFEGGADRGGLTIVATCAVDPLADEAADLESTVDRLRSSGADCVCYLGMGVAAKGLALGLAEAGWKPPVVANSALMFAYLHREWREVWDGWSYVDTLSDSNSTLAHLRELAPRTGRGPVGVAAYDIGRLLAEGLVRTTHLTRDGLRLGGVR